MSTKKLSDRVILNQTPQRLLIEVFPKYDKQKMLMLKLWVILWTVLGAIVLTQLFLDYAGQEKLFMSIYLALWAYFEYKMIHALRYNTSGKETLEFEDGKLGYSVMIGERGIPKYFNIDDLKDFYFQENTKTGFMGELQNSFWFVGGETIEFDSALGKRRVGMKLTEQEAKKVSDIVNKFIKKQAPNA